MPPAKTTDLPAKPLIFLCFFISGFASLLYQVLWTRLAFAQFGVITPVLSLTISTFMLGLGLGSFYGGRWVTALSASLRVSPLILYAWAEMLVALGAVMVPRTLAWGGGVLQHAGTGSSSYFLFLSAIFIVLALLPWCIAMGATVPLMMGFAGQSQAGEKSFSLLYVANVLGAAAGAAATAVALIELYGLHGTGHIGAAGNLLAAVLASLLAMRTGNLPLPRVTAPLPAAKTAGSGWAPAVLFITGFCSVGMEVCWTRDFTLELRTSIYAFAAILTIYLLATCFGSSLYKSARAQDSALPFERLGAWLLPLSLLPVFASDIRSSVPTGLVILSIAPFCGLLGYTTPGLVDRFAAGDARRTGHLYAINIAGGVLGPLAAGYILLPYGGIRWAILLLALPLAAGYYVAVPKRQPVRVAGLAIMFIMAAWLPRLYDEGGAYSGPHEIHRDFTTAVVASGTGMDKQLSVNGVSITFLTTITKVMAHMPMALQGHPHKVLDICFGMGTTFRSLSTWGVDVTAVDLSPSVLASFNYFHADTAAILANPHNHRVADDGRRYLLRTNQMFDVITLDPPPPVGAAGSSLLYSEQFYAVAKHHLAPGGILAQWVPITDSVTLSAVALSLKDSFPYIVVFKDGGTHFFASMTPITVPDAATLAARMPPDAQADLVEWEPGTTATAYMQKRLAQPIPLSSLLPPPGSNVTPITDDRPFNEYFLLRNHNLFLDLMLMQ
jgi:spermidine synthase